MNIRTAAQEIRDRVSMDDVLGLYGYKPRHGFLCCPFHGEKEPSLKIYPKTGGWHCFGCGRGGSVIDFVMEHESCDFRTAVTAIDRSLHLGLMDPHENPFEASREKLRQIALDNFVQAVYEYCHVLVRVIEGQQKRNLQRLKELEELRKGHIEKISADDWTFLLSWSENDQYDEYRKEKIEEFKEEVAAWRRRARRMG